VTPCTFQLHGPAERKLRGVCPTNQVPTESNRPSNKIGRRRHRQRLRLYPGRPPPPRRLQRQTHPSLEFPVRPAGAHADRTRRRRAERELQRAGRGGGGQCRGRPLRQGEMCVWIMVRIALLSAVPASQQKHMHAPSNPTTNRLQPTPIRCGTCSAASACAPSPAPRCRRR
jgi:hypothetical protein